MMQCDVVRYVSSFLLQKPSAPKISWTSGHLLKSTLVHLGLCGRMECAASSVNRRVGSRKENDLVKPGLTGLGGRPCVRSSKLIDECWMPAYTLSNLEPFCFICLFVCWKLGAAQTSAGYCRANNPTELGLKKTSKEGVGGSRTKRGKKGRR